MSKFDIDEYFRQTVTADGNRLRFGDSSLKLKLIDIPNPAYKSEKELAPLFAAWFNSHDHVPKLDPAVFDKPIKAKETKTGKTYRRSEYNDLVLRVESGLNKDYQFINCQTGNSVFLMPDAILYSSDPADAKPADEKKEEKGWLKEVQELKPADFFNHPRIHGRRYVVTDRRDKKNVYCLDLENGYTIPFHNEFVCVPIPDPFNEEMSFLGGPKWF